MGGEKISIYTFPMSIYAKVNTTDNAGNWTQFADFTFHADMRYPIRTY